MRSVSVLNPSWNRRNRHQTPSSVMDLQLVSLVRLTYMFRFHNGFQHSGNSFGISQPISLIAILYHISEWLHSANEWVENCNESKILTMSYIGMTLFHLKSPPNEFITPLNEIISAMNEFTLTMKKITTPLNGCMTALKKKVKPMIGCMGLWKMTTTKCLITNDRFQITNDKLEMINALWLIPMPKWPITNYKWGVRGNEILNSKLPTANRLQLKATSYTSAAAI